MRNSKSKPTANLLTRRQFLRTGIAGVALGSASPLLYRLLAQQNAHAGIIDTIAVKKISFFLSGGWASLNCIVGRDSNGTIVDGSLFNSYGQDSNLTIGNGGINNSFGAPLFAAANSGFTSGFTTELAKDTPQAPVSLAALYGNSGNDSTPGTIGSGVEAAAIIMSQTGAKAIYGDGVGTSNSNSLNGCGSLVSYPALARYTPQTPADVTAVTQFSQVFGAAATTQGLTAQQTASTFAAYAQGISDYESTQLSGLGTTAGETSFSGVMKSALQDLSSRASGTGGLNIDIAQDAGALAIIGTTQANFGKGQNDLLYGMIYACLAGAFAMAGIDLGGYDYHNVAGNSTNSPDSRNVRAGMVVGKAVRLAKYLNKALLFDVFTDGGLSWNATDAALGRLASTDARVQWSGDDQKAMGFLAGFVPSPTVNATQKLTQLGAVAPDTGFTDTSSVVGVDKRAAAAVLWNLVHLNGWSADAYVSVMTKAGLDPALISTIMSTCTLWG